MTVWSISDLVDLVTIPCPTCPVCGKGTLIAVAPTVYMAVKYGRDLIQDVMPDESPEVREMFITGTHPACWDTLKGDDECSDA